MKKILAYDVPMRVLHWLFAGLFLTAFLIAKILDDESPNYHIHMLIGLTLFVTTLLRIFWGLFGSKYARFSSFDLNPAHLIEYFTKTLNGKTALKAGHNPASSWAGLIMILQAIGLAVTGFLLTKNGENHFIKEVHEILANSFILVVIAHVLGIIIHTVKHKDLIGLSMVNGVKSTDSDEQAITSNYAYVAVLFVLIVGAFGMYLNKNYDPQSQKLNLFGVTLTMGENEEGEESEGKVENKEGNEGRTEQGEDEAEDEDGDDD